MFDDFDTTSEPEMGEYSDADRIDEMECVDDYNRFEEEQIFQDREGDDPIEQDSPADWEDDGYDNEGE